MHKQFYINTDSIYHRFGAKGLSAESPVKPTPYKNSKSKRFFQRITPSILMSILLLSIVCGTHRTHGSHPEESFGPAMSFEQVPGIGPCQAVEVAGNRLYATGQGKFGPCYTDSFG